MSRRVVILGQFYPPEPCAASNRLSVLARKLVERGDDVTVVTGMPSFPSGRIDERYAGRRKVREIIDGVKVHRVATYASPKLTARNRLLNWGSVALGMCLYLLARPKGIDVIVASSPPITLALPAIVGKLRHRAVLVADIRDVFPDVAIKMGEWREGSRIARVVGAIAGIFYRMARVVVCVTQTAQSEIIARGIPAPKIVVRANGFDAVDSIVARNFTRREGDFVISYIGNMGLATGLDVVLDAAVLIRDDPAFRFVLIGGGADAERLKTRIASEGLTNVELLGVLPRGEAMDVLRRSDATVIPLKRRIRDSLPTKMFDAMSVGCPIALSAEGEAADLLRRADAGIAVEPENPTALAQAVRELAGDPALRRRFAEHGEVYVREHYDRDAIMTRYAEAIGVL